MDGQLFSLLRGFSSLVPPNELRFPSHLSANAVNDFLLNTILLNRHLQQFPPSNQYQKRFWKWAIESLEGIARIDDDLDVDFEVDTRIYEHYLNLMPPSGPVTGPVSAGNRSQVCGAGVPMKHGPPSQSYITHFWRSERLPASISQTENIEKYQISALFESRTTIEGGTTGLRTWLASFVLAQYLIHNPEIVSHKRILELGSGIGFLGIIVASLQQLALQTTCSSSSGSIWLTDVNDNVLERCRDNLNLPCNLSSSHPDLQYIKLDWSESIDPEQSNSLATLLHETVKPELVLGADVVFDPSLIPSLVGTIKLALEHAGNCTGTSVLIALTVRNKATLNRFLTNVRDAELRIEELRLGFERTSFHQTVESNDSCQNVKLFRMTTALP